MSTNYDSASALLNVSQGATTWPVWGRGPAAAQTDWRGFWADCAAAGIIGVHSDRGFGGHGQSAAETVTLIQGLGEVCLDTALPMALNSQIWTVQTPLERFGSDQQKARYLPGLINGDLIGAVAFTEEGAGSDVLSAATTAIPTDDGYILNGQKSYVGMIEVCDLVLVLASTAPERKSWGLSLFLVEAGDPGVILGPGQPKIGLTSLPMGHLTLTDCKLPADRRLGPEGAGARLFNAILDWERSFIFAPQIGAMSRQLVESHTFAAERSVGGAPIEQYQSVSNRLADMATRLETSCLMVEKAADLYDRDALTSRHAAMTKLHVSEAYLASSLDAFRITGGRGYLEGTQEGTDVLNALGGVIYSGTSDIQRNLISRLSKPRR